MVDLRPALVLASASPARAALLRSAGIEPLVIPSDVDEAAMIAGLPASDIHAVTATLARAKARQVVDRVRRQGAPPGVRPIVVGADSMLLVGDRVVGKATGPDEVRRRWAAMAGGSGTLVTGHAVVDVRADRLLESTVATGIRFGRPDPVELEAYIATGEPLAVAGSCTIDGLGSPFIDGVEGDHTNVIGLSLPMLRRLLRAVGVRWTDLWDSDRVPVPVDPRYP